MFELGFVIMAAALLICSLALVHYLLGKETFGEAAKAVRGGALAVYNEVKTLIGTVSRRGWRPMIPWLFGTLFAVIIWRIANGQPLPNVAELATSIGGAGGVTALLAYNRSQEAIAGVSNNGPTGSPIEGRVMQAAQ